MMEKLTLQYWTSQLDPIWLEAMEMVHRGKNIEEAKKEAFGHLISDEKRLERATATDYKQLVNCWLSNKKFPKEVKRVNLDMI